MSNTIFDISFNKLNDRKRYRAHVEVTYKTENIIRFRITAGEKEMQMEKLLFRKTGQWKITNANFNLSTHDKVSSMLIVTIQKAIDDQVKILKII